jgi:hypothetical protein
MDNRLKTLINHGDKKYDTFKFRLDFAKRLLKASEIKPMIDTNDCDTESYIHPNGFSYDRGSDSDNDNNNDDDNNKSHDSRVILNKKLCDFNKVINDIGGKLLYIKSGTTGHTFKGMIHDDDTKMNINYAVKVVAYPRKESYGNMYDIRRPENAELMMIRALSYFVVNKQTPHIILPIASFNTSIEPFVGLIDQKMINKDNEKYQEFVDRYKNREYYDEVSILISEWANKGDLLEFIRKHYMEMDLKTWKVFFFQIISVLAIIQSKFPGFRHNDLKANNILVHKFNQRKPYFAYTINNCKYFVPNIGYFIKLWDFDFACIPGIVENAKVSANWSDCINIKPIQNKYYDMHYFFNTLIKKGFFPEFMKDKNNIIPIEAKEFVDRIVPKKFISGSNVSKRGRIMINDEYLTPDEVLKTDPFFEEFRNPKRKHKDKTKLIMKKNV